MRRTLLSAVAVIAFVAASPVAHADMAAAERWIDQEFQPSVLTREEQLAEMEWFVNAAQPYAGMEINVLSETIPTHEYESKVLTRAFEEITGIKVNHQLFGEGEVVQAVQTQMQTKRNLYDAYINDSDLIGTHSRLQLARQPDRLDGRRGQGRDQPHVSTSTTSSASPSPPGRTASSTSCPTSSSPTSIGSARTGSTARTCRPSSRSSTATTSACRSTGRPTRTSPSSSPSTSRRSTACASTATWTTASARPTWAGA